MKKCPFCAEEIQDDAIKCRFCYEFLHKKLVPNETDKVKWYFSTSTIVIAFLAVGPLALPLVWLHPKYKMMTKIISTVIIIGFTVWSYIMIQHLYANLQQQLKELDINLYSIS